MRTIDAATMTRMITDYGTVARLSGAPETMIGPDVIIDSRKATAGAFFVALPGESADGHDFVGAAYEQGAAAVMVTHPVDAEITQVIVNDTAAGLTSLARAVHACAREEGLRTVAITGSAGKTSTKDLTHQVLSAVGATVSPTGSYNNEIGTPLTVCRVGQNTDFLVAEMGSRAAGDIAHLCSIARPDVAMVCNVGSAHIGEFGSRENIARAKGEIYEALPTEGWAALNANDPLVAAMWQRTAAHRAAYRVGGQPVFDVPGVELEVHADGIVLDDLQRAGFTLVATQDDQVSSASVQLKVIGAHQVTNAAAAATAALCLGVDLQIVADALSNAVPRSPMRMEFHELANGAAVINDAYNANPDSMAAALRTLASMIADRRRTNPRARALAVVGDMLELGSDEVQLHRAMGELAAQLGIDEVWAIGDFAEVIADGAGERGRVTRVDRAAGSLQLDDGDVVLVKASRALGLERVANELVDREDTR
ncbi:UDP-N-acetylmuramoyl-tripeptide-D-alanyl-D-alanine ligase [Propionibacterium sp. oral taxon 192 str. F0372]|uniref:UDP-N-acetylmuramoyl-tripeptide--D-alanyl-D- alanine ligase n=1 Tax=Propionibacterium sp. oral taxon 192 TaxID=671222 RepID=UPI0003535321|nr:UDP-N-acetylmuramoyl-tripeptide--D-alanyl-D-alanine ligase [Propionibacterium sp. oral taxon 192]EPH02613.1 UDP-N-acetylmuramoyl-tripeptide-D-alanyl-D-alanine ligase [Propionibacterium sp. oral taxon 192 str. F0372]